MAVRLRGVVATPVTPFDQSGRIDTDAYRSVVNFLIQAGVHSLAMPMHVGESPNLSTEERYHVAETAVETAGGRVPVYVHVSHAGTDEAIRLARQAQSVGADGVVLSPPYHWEADRAGLELHYRGILDAIDIGVVAYNFPSRFKSSISIDFLRGLVDNFGNFTGIKDASFRFDYMADVCEFARSVASGFDVFVGVEHLVGPMALGATGCFSPTSEVAPNQVLAIYNACIEGKWEQARELQYRFRRLYREIRVGYPGGFKYAMALLGRPVGDTRRPIPPLTADERSRIERAITSMSISETEPLGWGT